MGSRLQTCKEGANSEIGQLDKVNSERLMRSKLLKEFKAQGNRMSQALPMSKELLSNHLEFEDSITSDLDTLFARYAPRWTITAEGMSVYFG